jgi:hypothetical protein
VMVTVMATVMVFIISAKSSGVTVVLPSVAIPISRSQ